MKIVGLVLIVSWILRGSFANAEDSAIALQYDTAEELATKMDSVLNPGQWVIQEGYDWVETPYGRLKYLFSPEGIWFSEIDRSPGVYWGRGSDEALPYGIWSRRHSRYSKGFQCSRQEWVVSAHYQFVAWIPFNITVQTWRYESYYTYSGLLIYRKEQGK